MKLTALIVDDEPLAREGLRMLLSADSGVSTIIEAKDGRNAILSILDQRPDLVFLDVQMPEMDGFDVIREVGAERMPAVVFVTAHDKYAIQAFEINAIDYLLKPVTEDRFTQALVRAKARVASKSSGEVAGQILSLLETITLPKQHLKRVAIRSVGKTFFVDMETIDWMGAAENYVELHAGRTTHLLNVPMSTLEKFLDPEVFLRVHRSAIVNIRCIKELQPNLHGEYVIVLQTGIQLQSGRTYHHRIKALTTNPF